MNRTDIINFYTQKYENCHYLEIGIGNPSANFNKIKAAVKDGVDPTYFCNNPVDSDTFFANNRKKYHVIFIDGDHKGRQVIKDVGNSLNCLHENGIILLHDCNPLLEEHQTENITVQHWNGSVWKAILLYRQSDPNLFICTVDTDEGIGIIKPNKSQELFKYKDNEIIDFNFLCKYRRQILNLISLDEWKTLENYSL
jgi:hypothetical protein